MNTKFVIKDCIDCNYSKFIDLENDLMYCRKLQRNVVGWSNKLNEGNKIDKKCPLDW